MTKDEKIVVVHDYHLDRICGVKGEVKDYNYADLPKIMDKVSVHFDDSEYDATNWPDKQLPLFDEVCKELRKSKKLMNFV